MNILYWNMHREYSKEVLHSLLLENDIDHVVLSEMGENCDEIIKRLTLIGYRRIGVINQDVYHFTRQSSSLYRVISESNKMCIVEYDSVLWEKILIVGLHLPSKLYRDEREQTTIAEDCIREIMNSEVKCAHSNTIIVGDFNLAPYETGMVSQRAFHSVMCPKVANSEHRIFDGKKRRFFYNPCWRLYGKYDEILGTYRYKGSKLCEYYWYMFDQVIYRPSMIDYVPIDRIEIISRTRNHSLYDNESMRIQFSDHLPIKFNIKLI